MGTPYFVKIITAFMYDVNKIYRVEPDMDYFESHRITGTSFRGKFAPSLSHLDALLEKVVEP